MNYPLLLSIIQQSIEKFSLDEPTFTEITKFFNLTSDPTYPHASHYIYDKFKNKLFDIFQTQGPNYKDYLNLPKFGALKLSTQQKLKTLFAKIWSDYQKKIDLQRNFGIIKDIEKLIPEFKSLDEVQAFHLDLLKFFKTSILKRDNQDYQNNKIPFPHIPSLMPQYRYKRPHQSTYYMPQVHPKYNPNPFPGMNSSIPKTVVPKIQDNQIWSDEKYVQSSSIFPIQSSSKPPLPQQNNPFAFPQPRKIDNRDKPIFHDQIDRQIERPNYPSVSHIGQNYAQFDQQDKQHIALNDTQLDQKVSNFLFSECACEGSLQSEDNHYFVCKKCQFYYHNQCLLINSGDSKNDICPCCKLGEGSNIFIKIHKDPVGKRWYKNFRANKLQMQLSHKQIQKLKAQRASCKEPSQIQYHLKFLRMVKKDKNAAKQQISQAGNTKRFNSIPLPKQFLEKVVPNNQFEISIKQITQGSNDEMGFFGIYLVQKFTQRQLLDRLFENLDEENSVQEQYMRRYLNSSQQEYLQIKMRDATSQKQIKYPVRGNQCQHAQIFDYMSFLQYYKQYGDKLSKKHCPVCEIQIQKVKADRFLWQRIKKIDGDGKEYESLRYGRDGRVEFVEEGESEDEEDDEMEEEDGEGEDEEEGSQQSV